MKDTSKLRLILICQLLVNESDAEHPLTIAKIRKILKDRYDLDTNRNTVTDDLRQLKAYGFPLEAWRSRQNRYYYNGRPFETAELKLLIDAVAASKFITERESQDLIGKITKLTTDAQAEKLKRHIYVDARPKTDNESGYYIVDAINEAIETGRKISFQYTDYDGEKNRILRHDGRIYILSPYALLWDGDYYYTIGWLDPPEKITALPDADCAPKRHRGRGLKNAAADIPQQQSKGNEAVEEGADADPVLTESALSAKTPAVMKTTELPPAGSLRTFRLDRIAAQPTILSEPAVPAPEDFDIAAWRRSVFRMYGTEEPIEVTLLCDNRVIRAIIDNFGTDAATQPVDENHFRITVTVCPSPTFYRWVFGWGWDGSIVVEGPDEVVRQYKKMLRKALRKQSSAEKMSDED